MNRDWRDFKSIYGNLAGAREGFEDACETLFTKKYLDCHVSQVAIKQGDGGIDIFIGELGIEPITVIQCKFFLESFGDSQKSQIRDSFKTAAKSDKYELKEWILCIPKVIDIDENSWWFKWKHKKLEEYTKSKEFIKLINGNALIDLMKECNVYNNIFKIEDSIKIDEIHKAVVPKKIDNTKKQKPNIVLFNNYTKKNEPFYFERKQDLTFYQNLKISNIWIFGQSGSGKTALINRNLIQNKIEYLFCDLSPITVNSVHDVFEEIICSIEDRFDTIRCQKEKNDIKLIVKLLNGLTSKRIVIVIDELHIRENNLLKSIASSFINLVTHYNNSCTQEELKFVVSTIADPETIIKNKPKASDYFQYICCNDWDTEIEQLYDILNSALDLNVVGENKAFVVTESKKSPRILKNIFRKIIASKDITDSSIQQAVTLTLKESY